VIMNRDRLKLYYFKSYWVGIDKFIEQILFRTLNTKNPYLPIDLKSIHFYKQALKVVKIVILTRHEKYKINLDCKIINS
jgi:hypothetical protein